MPRRPPWLIPAHARQERSSVGVTERALRVANRRACSSIPYVRGDPDIVVIGSGLNGLVAACLLARWGFRVVVLEAHPRRPGGALATEELTLPGFAHDVGPSWFPLAQGPALRALDLSASGLRWLSPPLASCHLARDGSRVALGRDVDVPSSRFDSEEDAATWRALTARLASRRRSLEELLLGPSPPLRALLRLDVRDWVHLERVSLSSASSLGRSWFVTEAARSLLPGLALHAAWHPDERRSGLLAYFLALTTAAMGAPLPVGGARSVTNALVTQLERHGGQLRLGSGVKEIVVRGGRVAAVRTEDGTELAVARGVLADVPWATLLLELVDARHWPSRALRQGRELRRGTIPEPPALVQVNWALAAPIPWACDLARRSGVVHIGELAIAQPSLFDPSRAPPGRHTASCAAPLPAGALHGTPAADLVLSRPLDDLATDLERRIEAFAPGFRAKILARRITLPGDGSGLPRGYPLPYFRYVTPIRGLYLCSGDTHPGPGIHGVCGSSAARRAARDLA